MIALPVNDHGGSFLAIRDRDQHEDRYNQTGKEFSLNEPCGRFRIDYGAKARQAPDCKRTPREDVAVGVWMLLSASAAA